VLGPWFVVLGTLFLVVSLVNPAKPGSDDLLAALWFPLLFIGVGLVLCYLAFFRSVTRVEIRDQTMYWYLPFRRLRDQAPLTDIVSLWAGQSIGWSVTRTVFIIDHARPVSIRDQWGIKKFVAELVAREPAINLDNWEPRESLWAIGLSPAASRHAGEDGVVERRARAAQLRRRGLDASKETAAQDPR